MSDRYSYHNLILWQRSQELAHEVLQLVKRFPQTWAAAIIGRQIISSVTSIGANIAEGDGRYSRGAHRNHLSIARGSATETDSWLDLMRREGIISREEEEHLHAHCGQVIAMLTAKMISLEEDDTRGGKRIRDETVTYTTEDDAPIFPFEHSDYLIE